MFMALVTLYFNETYPPVANVLNFFGRKYVAISVTSVKIIGKCTASGINYA
jgi:hypothetical protein